MENNILEHFPYIVMQHIYQRRGWYPKDQGNDWSWKKLVEYQGKGKLNKYEHDKRCDIHATHVEHTETQYDETTTNPFEDIESHTTSGDTEPNILNIFLLPDCITTNTILRGMKYFIVFKWYIEKAYHRHH